MNRPAPSPMDDDDDRRLHALVDGQLPPDEADALRARLDADALARLADWQQQRDALRTLHAGLADAGLPQDLRRAADALQHRRDQQMLWRRWGGIAAGWLLAFGLGWGLHGHWSPSGDTNVPLAQATGTPLAFVRQAAVAHAVFQPEQRHPVEVTAAQQEHLVQWLSKRLGRPLAVPALSAEGFDLMGGRLLPGGAGARAQFMYQNAGGQRITLYVGAVDGTAGAAGGRAAETAFRFNEEGPVASFYWVDRGFGYALSGEMPRAALLALATAVHRQLVPD
ncbi:anti-sigma factor family protein [Paracidovorax wautersii]|uniref:Transmembrane transcriptional regulator (Anti-sigma factor RsiW) n=1 Tax=Paracidovorax wautersii TaxID=1177982 RepID=A0A1I2H090_9BURK|nr:anti-sigma factor [Paracidovorax wautersii]SFF22948.1 Transmembrane transcriptional regulator (anti-sigma factor RsiW) [Paracidovorax wautersii]